MEFAVGEPAVGREEGRCGPFERIGEEEAEDEAAKDCKASHQEEQPFPPRAPGNAAHVQNTIGEQLGTVCQLEDKKIEEIENIQKLT